jgi:hypothetical protein
MTDDKMTNDRLGGAEISDTSIAFEESLVPLTVVGRQFVICHLSFVILKLPAMPPSDASRTDEIREIKQIAALATGEIVALCSDSTVWIYAGSNWRKLPDLGETP